MNKVELGVIDRKRWADTDICVSQAERAQELSAALVLQQGHGSFVSRQLKADARCITALLEILASAERLIDPSGWSDSFRGQG